MLTVDRASTIDAMPAAPSSERVATLPRVRVWVRRLSLPLLISAGLLLVASLLLPYWNITLHAPQYPQGLNIQVYAYKLTGDVFEVDGLNHYIGMMKLGDAAKLERAVSRVAIPLIALLAVVSFWVPGRWKWLAVTPLLIYPVVFILDLFAWLYYAGHSLDPTAALSSSISEFTPRLLGTGTIGQFRTEASFDLGFYLALLAAVIVLVVMLMGRKAGDEAA
ncbi:MAG: cytochrome C [Chloroflexi bacterium]|nr:MAG: cytochrome C [Chloroflexota bacterium]